MFGVVRMVRGVFYIPVYCCLLRATRGVRSPNLQVVITHVWHVCSQHSFGHPLRMYEMHRTQFDHAHLDLLSVVTWSRVFWSSVTWNLLKAQHWSSLKQKRVDLQSLMLPPALRNLWLLLVSNYITRRRWGRLQTSSSPTHDWTLLDDRLRVAGMHYPKVKRRGKCYVPAVYSHKNAANAYLQTPGLFKSFFSIFSI